MYTETYSLQFPYTTSAGQRVESISLKRLKVKDIKAVKKSAMTQATGMTRCCRV